MRLIFTFACCAAMLGIQAGAAATVLEPGFVETSVLPAVGGSAFTGMAWATDGSQRLFLTRQDGRVQIMKNGTLLATPFSADTVFSNSECGLIGIAFDPSFAQNGFVYLFETVSSTEQRIVRYTASGDIGTNKQTVVSGLPTRGLNHDGGAIGFGPDGKLYWGIGDNGNFVGTNADLTSLASKIGRANRNGTVPSDNPFVDGAGPQNDYIWARGFRNPFTLAFRPDTGALWVDVAGTGYEQIFVVSAGSHAGYHAFENNQPAGFLAPTVAYLTNGDNTFNLMTSSGAVRSGGVATFTTTVAHGFRPGAKITIAGVSDASFNGSGFVLATPSSTTFTLTQAGPNANSGAGTATMPSLGGAVTGGDFWSASGLPTQYRGNYFFGDYNSASLIRVALGPSGTPTSVDRFANASSGSIDVASGPDGALYWLMVNGALSRISYVPTAQGLVVSPLHVRFDEGGRGAVSVRLAQAPAGSVNVAAAMAGGSSDVSIVSGGSTSFNASNWSVPQTVLLQALSDTDALEDNATLRFSSAGLASEDANVHVTDSSAPSGVATVPTTLPRHFGLLGLLLGGSAALALSRRGARSRGSRPAAA